MNALMNIVVGQSEGSEKRLLLNEKSDAIQKNGISEGELDAGAGHGALFFQMLKHIIGGGGKSHSGASALHVVSRTSPSESDRKNERHSRLSSIGTMKRHISHRMGKSATDGSEKMNIDSSNGKATDTVNATSISTVSSQGDQEKGKTILPRHGGQQNVREGFDVSIPTNSHRNDEKGKLNGKTGIQFLQGTSDSADDQTNARLIKTKNSDEKAIGAVPSGVRGRKNSVAGESMGINSQKEKAESLVDNLSDKAERPASGKQTKQAYSKSHHGQPVPSHEMKQHESMGENISKRMAEAIPTQKVAEMYARDSHRYRSGESEMSQKPTDKTPALRRQGTAKTHGKVKQQFMVSRNTGQGGDGTGNTDNSDGLNSNEQRTKDFPREVRLTDRTLGGKHFAPARIEAQTMVDSKTQEPLSVKSHDIINQVATAVQTKLAKGFGRVKIELNPPHLGSIDLDVIVRNNKVHVILRAEQYDVRQLLQSNADVLKTALNTQGLIAETIDVSLHDRMGGNAFQFDRDGRLFDNRQGKSHDGGKKGDEEASPDGRSMVESTESPAVQTNGQISLFA